MPRSFLLSFAFLAVTGCVADRVTAPATPIAPAAPRLETSAAVSPQFLQPAAGAPTIANPVISFWAKRGVATTAEMYYHATPGAKDSVVFFSLRLRDRSLWRRPDGTLVANGDSVLVTLTLVDAQRGIVECQPSGLKFEPGREPRLKISFLEADQDFNHDGVVNATDAAITRALAVWRRETPSDPWLRMVSKVDVSAHEVETEIGGFTGYAIAW